MEDDPDTERKRAEEIGRQASFAQDPLPSQGSGPTRIPATRVGVPAAIRPEGGAAERGAPQRSNAWRVLAVTLLGSAVVVAGALAWGIHAGMLRFEPAAGAAPAIRAEGDGPKGIVRLHDGQLPPAAPEPATPAR